ncbi:MAG: hypothetical protein R3F19_34395 [Verrucomicrobiales bacterium]
MKPRFFEVTLEHDSAKGAVLLQDAIERAEHQPDDADEGDDGRRCQENDWEGSRSCVLPLSGKIRPTCPGHMSWASGERNTADGLIGVGFEPWESGLT